MYNRTATIFDLPSEEGNTNVWLKSLSVMLSQCHRTYKANHFFPYTHDHSEDASGFAKPWGNEFQQQQ